VLWIEGDGVAILITWRKLEGCYAIHAELDGGTDDGAINCCTHCSDRETCEEERLFSGCLLPISGDIVEEGDGEREEGEATAAIQKTSSCLR
jgi:hypothetical protein